MNLGFFSSDIILRNFTFLAFLSFLAIVYIANRHYAERNVRQVQILQKQISEQRNYLKSLQSENMVKRRHAIIADKARADGLRQYRKPPYKLVIPPPADL